MPPTPLDPLSRALLPVLLHGLANTTQLLKGLEAMLRIEGGEELFAARAPDLARASAEVEDLGFALAVLGSAGGARLLLARREPRGLAILFGLVRSALRREERDLSPPPGPWPLCAPDVLSGWELPWAFASVLLAAGRDGSPSEVLSWRLAEGPAGWTLELPGERRLDEAVERVRSRLLGTEWAREGSLVRGTLPAPWLKAGS